MAVKRLRHLSRNGAGFSDCFKVMKLTDTIPKPGIASGKWRLMNLTYIYPSASKPSPMAVKRLRHLSRNGAGFSDCFKVMKLTDTIPKHRDSIRKMDCI